MIALPTGKSIQITAPGASGRNRLKYIDGLTIDRQPSNQTFLPESIVRTGGDLTFSLAGTPNKVWEPRRLPRRRHSVRAARR